jgi:hypothetical protein
MAVRPVFFDSANGAIVDMDDSDLELLVYRLQRAYAQQLNGSGDGHINVGGSGTAIGSAADTSATQQTNTVTRGLNNGIIETFPGFPGIGSETDATYNYKQDQTTPDAISAANLNVNGMLFFDSANDEFEPITEAGLQDYILNKAIVNMRTGNEVGTYRAATSEPSNGGAGVYVDKGTFFADTTFNQGTTTTKLWLKVALDTDVTHTGDASQDQSTPLGLDSDGSGTATGNIIQRSLDSNGRLIQNVLLPALTRRMSEGLHYVVSTSAGSGDSAGGFGAINRGSFTDTKQTGTSNTTSFSNPTYSSISTPSGTASTVTTFTLNLIA